MNTSMVRAARFGQVDWNISRSTANTVDTGTNFFNIIGVAFEIPVIVFFLVAFFGKPSNLQSPYYVIYTMGCVVDAAPKLSMFFGQYIIFNNVVSNYTSLIFSWYNSNFVIFCNFVLALNRFTAIVFAVKFNTLWSKRITAYVCVMLVFYPLIMHCFNLLPVYYMTIRQSLPKGVQETDFEKVFLTISSLVYAVCATGVTLHAVFHILFTGQLKDTNVEKILLVQSLTSSIFITLSTTSAWLATVNKYDSSILPYSAQILPEITRLVTLQVFFLNMSRLFFSCHQYISLVLIVIASKTFRDAFFKFYGITWVIKKFKQLREHFSSENRVTILHPSMAPPPKKGCLSKVSSFLKCKS